MVIIQVSGKLRQGKGVLLTLFALLFAQSGGRVLSNYSIKAVNCSKIDFYDFLYLLKRPRSEVPTLLVIDELPTWIDSYCTTTSEANRMASHFCNQSAKLGYDLEYSAQRTRRADINYREMVDVSFQAHKDVAGERFVYNVLDPDFVDEDVLTNRRVVLPFRLAERWWHRYDTFESVTPVGLDDFLVKMERSDPERLLATVNSQAAELVGYRGNFSVASVKLALLDRGLSPVFADLVAVRLREGKR